MSDQPDQYRDLNEKIEAAIANVLADADLPHFITGWTLLVEGQDDDGEIWLSKYSMNDQKMWRSIGMLQAYLRDMEYDFVIQGRE